MYFDALYDWHINSEEKLALVRLGYLGMPIVVVFSKHIKATRFDLNESKFCQYRNGIVPTNEIEEEAIRDTTVEFTADESRLRET